MNFLKIFSNGFQDNWEAKAITDFKTGTTLTYSDLAARMEHIHILLEALGAHVGTRVAVIGDNSIDWIAAYMACITYGATTVSLPRYGTIDEIMSSLISVNTEILFIDSDLINDPAVFAKASTMRYALSIDTTLMLHALHDNSEIEHYQELLDRLNQRFNSLYPCGFRPDFAIAPVLKPDDVSAIFFTAGTTGTQRPVMLMAENLEGNIIHGIKTSMFPRNSSAVSSTQFGSVWGTIFNVLVPLSSGAHLTITDDVRNPRTLAEMFMKVKPRRIMLSARIMTPLFEMAETYNNKRTLTRWSKKLPGGKYIKAFMLKRTLRSLLGGKYTEILLGSVPIGTDFYSRLRRSGMPLTIIYGLTECGGLVAYSPWHNHKLGSAGNAINGLLRCRIRPYSPKGMPDNAGILEVCGMSVMKGYADGSDNSSRNSLTSDGWFSTGDLATMDSDGNVTIIGRKDTLIHLSRGAIAPEQLQTLLFEKPEIAHAIVIGEDDALTAILFPDKEAIARRHPDSDLDEEQILNKIVHDINRTLPLISRIDNVIVSSVPLKTTYKGTVARKYYIK